MANVTRVLIADDHAIVRQGLRSVIESDPDFRVLVEVDNGQAALDAMASTPLDVAIIDVSMPVLDGMEVLVRRREIASTPAIIVLTMFPEDHLAWHILKAGAAAYLSKTRPSRELVAAIRSVARTGRYTNEDLEDRAIENQLDEDRPHTRFTTREYQIFLSLVGGQSVNEIADSLGCSASTVSNHVAAIRQKLGVRSVADFVHYAYRTGLL